MGRFCSKVHTKHNGSKSCIFATLVGKGLNDNSMHYSAYIKTVHYQKTVSSLLIPQQTRIKYTKLQNFSMAKEVKAEKSGCVLPPPAPITTWPPPTMTIAVVYDNTMTGGGVNSIELIVPSGLNAQTVLEIAANVDKDFRFTSKYFDNTLGYSLIAIGGIAADEERKEYYQLLVGTTGFPLSSSPVGYSGWYPFDQSTIRWNLTKY